ncbi:MAG TPA: type II toxin-antitoxin system VapC family toxin [Planctomycetota bacterium]|nr:type II toxin-antitoxin system VapC family toxin [Planctomycetota bacterium]
MLVIDASVTLAWCLPDQRTAFATAAAEAVAAVGALVPGIWALEVGNVLQLAVRRGHLPGKDLARILQHLAALPLHVAHHAPTEALGGVLELAQRHELTTYDAAYLELAQRAGLMLATLDDELGAAAGRERVRLFQP